MINDKIRNLQNKHKNKKKKDEKKKKKRKITNLELLFYEYTVFNGKIKSYYSGDYDSVRLDGSIGTINNGTTYLLGCLLDTYDSKLNRNSINFSITNKNKNKNNNFINYDLMFTYNRQGMIGTYGNISCILFKYKGVLFKTFVDYEAIFNDDYYNFDLFSGIDINKEVDKVFGGLKVANLIYGKSNDIDGTEQSHEGISILPYIDVIVDHKRNSTLFMGIEKLNKKIGNTTYNYDNFRGELNLIKDKTMVFSNT